MFAVNEESARTHDSMPPKMPPLPMTGMPPMKSKAAPNKSKTKAKPKFPKLPLAQNAAVGMPPKAKSKGKKLPPFMAPMMGGPGGM